MIRRFWRRLFGRKWQLKCRLCKQVLYTGRTGNGELADYEVARAYRLRVDHSWWVHGEREGNPR